MNKTLQVLSLAAFSAAISFAALPICPSGDTMTQLNTYLQSTPCTPGAGITLRGPLTLASAVVPLNMAHPNITTDDIIIKFGFLNSTPTPTISMVFDCAACAVTAYQSSQIAFGAYFTGTLINFGVLLSSHSFGATQREVCMGFSELDAEAGAGVSPSNLIVRAAQTYQYVAVTPYVPGSVTFPNITQLTFDLMQSGFSCSFGQSFEATLYLQQNEN